MRETLPPMLPVTPGRDGTGRDGAGIYGERNSERHRFGPLAGVVAVLSLLQPDAT